VVLDEDLDRAGRDAEDHVGGLPEWGDAEDVGVEVAVAHAARLLAGRTATRTVGVGSRVVRPTRLMSDSVLHFSDSRFAALQHIETAETGLGWSSTPARRRLITSRRRSRFWYPHTIRLIRLIRLIRWIRASVDSAAPFGRSITTASRCAVNRESGSVHGVVARTRLAAPRAARLAAVLEEEHDRADSDVGDHVGDVRCAGVPGMLTQRSRSPMPRRCGRDGSREACQGWVTHTKA